MTSSLNRSLFGSKQMTGVGVFGLALMLAGCGGGSVNSASGPTPVLTPSPTPQTNAQLPLTVSQTFDQAASAKIIATVDNQTGAVQDVTLPSRASFATLSVTYDAAANSYTVADEASSKTFAPADGIAGTSSFDHYRQTSGTGANDGTTTVSDLYLFKPGPANARLALTYASYGIWSTSQQGSANTHFLTRFATYGIQTAATDMPRSGTGTYSGIVDGLATINNQAYRLTGSTGSITANFSTGVVRNTLNLIGNPDPLSMADGATALGAVTGTGAIASGSSRYTGTMTGLGASGSFGGGFYGPKAAETAFAFSLNGGTASVTGAFVGKK